jgi:hypothetical protein
VPDGAVGSDLAAPDGAHASPALLYTPAEAAVRLGGVVTEAWLRRKAGERKIPCTRLMGYLGFSERDLAEILDLFHSPAKTRASRR